MQEMEKAPSGRILVVEDEPALREILKETLSSIAATVDTAENGAEALPLIKSGVFDAVITDVSMPKMNGLQMLAEVRKALVQTPIVVLTAHGDSANIIEALRLNAVDFLEKPCAPEKVKEIMGKALELGLAMRAHDAELDLFYANSKLPADQIANLKHVKRTIVAMRSGFKIFHK